MDCFPAVYKAWPKDTKNGCFNRKHSTWKKGNSSSRTKITPNWTTNFHFIIDKESMHATFHKQISNNFFILLGLISASTKFRKLYVFPAESFYLLCHIACHSAYQNNIAIKLKTHVDHILDHQKIVTSKEQSRED